MLSTFTVTNTRDGGTGSLRAEISDAHKGDTIACSSSLNGQTITLTSGELLIKKNLTIAGPGAGQLTVSGNNASRVFEIASGCTDTLSDLTITAGAGVYASGSTHSSKCVLSASVSSTIQGGAIHNEGTLTVNGRTLSGNSASVGGAIQNYGTAAVSSSSIISGNSAAQGGWIWNNGTLNITDSILSGNGNRTDGGGISNNGTATVSSNTFSGNLGIRGGAIENWAGTLSVSGCARSSNSASYEQGAMFINGGGVTLTGDTMISNTATSYSGGILIVPTSGVFNDSFTVANTIDNTDRSGLNGPTANIDGTDRQR
jgi:hypothetical protein